MPDLLKKGVFILLILSFFMSGCATVKSAHDETREPVLNKQGYELGKIYPIKFENKSGFYIIRIEIATLYSLKKFTILRLADNEISEPVNLQIGEELTLLTKFRGRNNKIIETTKKYTVIKPDNIIIIEKK
jgi:starvation-inducible outer membrane lipoprotein